MAKNLSTNTWRTLNEEYFFAGEEIAFKVTPKFGNFTPDFIVYAEKKYFSALEKGVKLAIFLVAFDFLVGGENNQKK